MKTPPKMNKELIHEIAKKATEQNFDPDRNRRMNMHCACVQAITEALAPVECERDGLKQKLDHEEAGHLRTIDSRDCCEQQFSHAYYLATGDSPEWSNNFGHEQAALEIAQTVNLLKSHIQQLESSAAKVREDALREAIAKLESLKHTETLGSALGYGIAVRAACQSLIESLITTPASNAELTGPKGDQRSVIVEYAAKTNGGVVCDAESGPCACGAWHEKP